MKTTLTTTSNITNFESSIPFSIDADSTAFIIQMVSSKLYEYPVKAMLRETITNALDANNTAGNSESPIEIKLRTTETDLLYSVADSGSGMSPDCVGEILTKLGKSSKSSSNDEHGGYGMGILSIFSVASQAQIQTIYEGISYNYILFLNAQSIPAISLVSSQPSAERAGTTVTVPIAKELQYDLKCAAEEFARTIVPCPKVDYCQADGLYCQEETNVVLQGNNWSLLSIAKHGMFEDVPSNIADLRLTVKIGQIPYSLGYDYLNIIQKRLNLDPESEILAAICQRAIQNSRASAFRWGLHLVLHMPIGVINLPGSRESIPDNLNNSSLIMAALKAAAIEMTAYFKEVLALESTSLQQKINIAKNWLFPEFVHDGITYSLKELEDNKIYVQQIVETTKGKTKLKDTCHTYLRLLEKSRELCAVVCSRRYPLTAIKKLLAERYGDVNNWPTQIAIFSSEESYKAELANQPLFALTFKEVPLLVDNPRIRQAEPSDTLKRKHTVQLKKIEEVRYIPSLWEIGRQSVERLEDYELGYQTDPITEWPASVTYSLITEDNPDYTIWAYGRLCYRLNIDSDLYLVNDKMLAALKYFGNNNLLEVKDVVDPALRNFIDRNFQPPLTLGCFPGLDASGNHWGGCSEHAYLKRLERLTQLIDTVCNNVSLRAIADPNKLAALKSFLPDLDLWMLLIDHGGYLNLCNSLALYSNKDRKLNNIDDRGLVTTLPTLLAPVLDRLPFFKKNTNFKVEAEDLDDLFSTLITLEKLL